MNSTILSRTLLILSICVPPVATAFAQSSEVAPIQNPTQLFTTPDYRGDLGTRRALLGDLGGIRQQAANDGITIDANLTQVTQGVTSGGRDTGWEYMGRGETTLNLDTSKLGWWPGGLFSIMGEGNFGDSIASKTGTLIGANQNALLPESENSFVLSNVTFTQFLSPEIGFTLGKIATINDKGGDMNEFAHGKGNDQFLNLAFNINPVSALTVPYTTLGLSVVYIPIKEFVGSVAILDPHGKANSAGFDTLFENGATFASEGRYTTNFFGLTGHQLLGGTYSSSSYTDLDQGLGSIIIPGLPTENANNSWCLYWNADQYLYQPEPGKDRGFGLFARYGHSDGEANPIENFASIGLGGKGMFPSRENDRFGIGYAYTWVTSRQLTDQLGFEDAQTIEAFYEFAVTPSVFVSPDIQWLAPSQQRVNSSWVLGARLYTVF